MHMSRKGTQSKGDTNGWKSRFRDTWSLVRENEHVMAIMGSTGLMMLGHGCAAPVLPLLAKSMGASATEVGLSLSVFAVSRYSMSPSTPPQKSPTVNVYILLDLP